MATWLLQILIFQIIGLKHTVNKTYGGFKQKFKPNSTHRKSKICETKQIPYTPKQFVTMTWLCFQEFGAANTGGTENSECMSMKNLSTISKYTGLVRRE